MKKPALSPIILADIKHELQNSGLYAGFRSIEVEDSPIQEWGCLWAFELRIQIESQHVNLHVGLDERFPFSLPIVYLVPENALGFIPHIQWKGYVCYVPQEGLVLNKNRPGALVCDAVARAIKTLTEGVRGNNRGDFINEFEVYWRRLPEVKRVLSFISPSQSVREIKTIKQLNQRKDPYSGLSDSITAVQEYFSGDAPSLTFAQGFNALYVPLEAGTFILPPDPSQFWSRDEIRQIVFAHISDQNARSLKKLTQKWKPNEILVLKLSRPAGGEVLLGIHFEGVKRDHPLNPNGYATNINPLVLERHDKDYLLPRGGASIQLQAKHVALIGCGAVGGFLAQELVRAGVLSLTLVDGDNLSADNTFRHTLGNQFQGQLKVTALKQELSRKFPYTKITTIPQTVENALKSGLLKASMFDLLVVAVGNETVSLYLNQTIRKIKQCPPIIFTWLEPYGLGGHTLLTNNGTTQGCFECLFTATISSDAFCNRANFVDEGQVFTKDMTGCGTLFTPYGSSDALQTAVMASRLAVDALLDRVDGNPLLSWKGNPREFLRAGFKLSSRYGLSETELWKGRYSYYNPRCPICG